MMFYLLFFVLGVVMGTVIGVLGVMAWAWNEGKKRRERRVIEDAPTIIEAEE